MRKLFRSRKALSPVVAAIILIAVTVAVSIAVAAWMGALTFTFMKTEELKITSHEWTAAGITLNVRNTGTANLILVYAEVNSVKTTDLTDTIAPGGEATVDITAPTGGFVDGVKYEFAIVTKAGNRYTYTAVAPS